MKRDIWTKGIEASGKTEYVCSECEFGVFISKETNIIEMEIPESIDSKEKDSDWESDWYSGLFSGFLECSNCKIKVFISGISYLDLEPVEINSEHYELSYTLHLKPKYFSKPPNIINLPQKIPNEVRELILDSFKLFFIDLNSAANKIRIALELLLDNLKVPRNTKTNRNKLRRLSLYERLTKIKGKASKYVDHFQVFRILGNEGSHETNLHDTKILDLFEVLEHFLVEYYDQRSDKVYKIIKNVTKK